MKTVKAYSLAQAHELLSKHQAKSVELCFEFSTDDFFRFAEEWCDKGAKISKGDYFVVRIKNFPTIPPFN